MDITAMMYIGICNSILKNIALQVNNVLFFDGHTGNFKFNLQMLKNGATSCAYNGNPEAFFSYCDL